MLDPAPLIMLGSIAAAAAVMLLRRNWALLRRSVGRNAAAWALLSAAVVAGWTGAGAWGTALVSLVAMAAACLCLLQAAWSSPPGRAAASNRRANMLPEGSAPLLLGRRCVTFLLAVPAAMMAALAVSLAARALADLAGWREADSAVLMLLLIPLLWALAMSLLLLWPRRRTQILLLGLPCAASIGLVLAVGIG